MRSDLRGTLELVTPPAKEPVLLADAKEHLKEDGSDSNDYIDGLIVAARRYVENDTSRALINQTWLLRLDRWPPPAGDSWWDGVREGAIADLHTALEVEIRKAPFSSLSEVRTLDEAGAVTVWPSGNYYTATRSGFGRLVAKQGVTFPTPGRHIGGIEIEFVAGYGADGTDVPYDLRLAMKQLIAHWFDHRLAVDACVTGTTQGGPSVPLSVNSLLSAYRVLSK